MLTMLKNIKLQALTDKMIVECPYKFYLPEHSGIVSLN